MIATKSKELYQKYEKFLPASFFILGFVYDVATLGRIDHWTNTLQQVLFLVVVGTFLYFELREKQAPLNPQKFWAKAWKHKNLIIQFCFGALLNAYAIFYFKSASFFSSFIFLFFIVVLVVANELPAFQRLGVVFRFALFSLCLTSFVIYVTPIIFGMLGFYVFLASLLLSLLIHLGLFKVFNRFFKDAIFLVRHFLFPSFTILGLFFVFYFLHMIPPVPLSIQYMGIYHNVEKIDDKYKLTYTRPWWKFWQNGDQDFVAQEGDKIYCFARIFSPATFKDKIFVHWLFDTPERGWETSDRIPLTIVGGRDEGFRGYTYKKNYEPGSWRVQIETEDGREIGRIAFEVTAESLTSPPEKRYDHF